MSDRPGIKHAWEQTEDSIKGEIKAKWRDIIRQETNPEKAVDLILDDLTDRRGLRQEWEQIDDDVQAEIKKAWVKLIHQV
ncbi:MAG: hypothetical protein WAT81_04550 [Candidatus Moraniibacteriota bacterium]